MVPIASCPPQELTCKFVLNPIVVFVGQNLDEVLDHKTDLSDKLMHIGDSIVYKLVQWTKRLPFYLELPVEVGIHIVWFTLENRCRFVSIEKRTDPHLV